MSLIQCPECNKEISDKAISCPHCGFPMTRVTKQDNRPNAPIYPFVLVILSFVAFVILGRFGGIPILIITGLTAVPVIFSLYISSKSVKEKHRRWGWCLATLIIGIMFLVLYSFMWISAIIRWIK